MAVVQETGRCKTNSLPAFHSAKRSYEELADLVRGGDLQRPKGLDGPLDNWDGISQREPIMNRLHRTLRETSSVQIANNSSFSANQEKLVEEGELMIMFSTVLRQPGSEGSDDEDDRDYASQLTVAAREIVEAARNDDFVKATAALSQVKHACTQCHADFH